MKGWVPEKGVGDQDFLVKMGRRWGGGGEVVNIGRLSVEGGEGSL